jgi:Flp pilus assembly protein TadB
MRRQMELRDLRSLERRSMYSIFRPLDPDERLPRELVLEGRRYRWFDKRRLFWLVGIFYLPALMLAIVVLASLKVSMLVAFGVAGIVLLGIFVYAFSARST